MVNAAPGQPQPAFLLVGEVLRPHGVQGEMKVRVLTEYPERIATVPALFLGAGVDASGAREIHVQSMRMHQGFALVKLREYPDRTVAERLRGLFLMVRLEDAVPLEEGEFYLYQVIGLPVRTEEGVDLGVVTEVLETGANDVYIVHGDLYGEVLIPVTPDTIVRTDIVGRLLTVRLPEGLLPDAAADQEQD
ncbi:MAG TPA: ribosome maturation factor RimM [Candidatus Limnocylindrales bacterium]|nr:ribosome maturation factor RimM [Candidatus Limnocylindrales bacterium]